MYKAIGEFYEPLSRTDARQYERGQMWWTCCPYPFKETRITRVWPDGKAVPMDVCEFDPSKERRDKEANTDPSEFYAIVKCKRRPVVILSMPGTPYRDRAWHGGDWFLIAPVRSLREPLTGHPAQLVYPSIIPPPPLKGGGGFFAFIGMLLCLTA
jgi:hypothetical protein